MHGKTPNWETYVPPDGTEVGIEIGHFILTMELVVQVSISKWLGAESA